MAANVTLHFFASNDINGSVVYTLTDEDPVFRELNLKLDRSGLGGGEVLLARAVGEDFNFPTESFVRILVAAYSTTDYYPWGLFLNKRLATVIDRDEDGGEVYRFGGAGPKMYMDRGALGIGGPAAGWNVDLDNGVWRWGNAATVGRILERIRAQDANMDDPALGALTLNFDETDDSNGVAWTDTSLGSGDRPYTIPIGTSMLQSLYDFEDLIELSSWIDLGTVASPKYELNVIQGLGEDVTGSSFGAGVCLLREGDNIANDGLSVQGHALKKASHVIVEGADGAWVIVERLSFTPGDYVKYAKTEFPRTSQTNLLTKSGLRWLQRQDLGEREYVIDILPGVDDSAGAYFPAPDRVLWLDKRISLDTSAVGTTPTLLDIGPSTEQLVTGLELRLGEASDDSTGLRKSRSWFVKAILNRERSGTIRKTPDQRSASSGNGGCCGAKLCVPGSPGSPAIALGTLLFDSEVAGENSIIPDWTEPDAENVGEGWNRLNLGDTTSTNPGPENHDEDPWVSVINSVGTTDPNWTGDACLGAESTGTSNTRRACWGLLEGWTLSPHLMDAADGSIGESGWQIRITGTVKHVRGTATGNSYPDVDIECEVFSDTNAGTKAQADTTLVNNLTRGQTVIFDEIIDLDPSAQSIAIESHAVSGSSGNYALWEHLRVELIRPGDEIPAVEASGGDGHPDLVGTGNRAKRCDARENVFRDTAPTADDDADDGYHVGTTWVQVDSLSAPTAIVGTWLLLDNTATAAVWESTGGGTDDQTAAEVPFTPAGTIAATDTQAAVEEVATDAAADLAGHTGDATDAHDASAISVLDAAGKFTGTDVEAVLAELDDSIAAGGIPATIFDAAGDIIVASAADTAARLAIGAALQHLRVNAAGTGLEYADPPSGGGGPAHNYRGYNVIGGTAEQATAFRWYMKKITLDANEQITSIDAYIQGRANGVTPNVGIAVHADNAGAPGILQAPVVPFGPINPDANSADGTAGVARWLRFPITYHNDSGSAQDVWIAFAVSQNTWNVHKDTGGADRYYTAASLFPSDAGWTAVTTTTDRYSIRAKTIT